VRLSRIDPLPSGYTFPISASFGVSSSTTSGYDLDKLLSLETGLPVIVAEDPLTCVARGGGKALDMMDRHAMDLLSTE